jgi:hypothetical protein
MGPTGTQNGHIPPNVKGIAPGAVAKEGADIAKRTPKNTGSALHSEPLSTANDAKNFIEQRARASGSSGTAFEADKRESQGGVGPRPTYHADDGLRADLDAAYKRKQDAIMAKLVKDREDRITGKTPLTSVTPENQGRTIKEQVEAQWEKEDEDAKKKKPVATPAKAPEESSRAPRERKQTDRTDPSLEGAPAPASSNMARLRDLYREIEGAEIEGNPFLKNGRFSARSEYGKWYSRTIHGPDSAKNQEIRRKIDTRHNAGRPTRYSMLGVGKPKRGRSSDSSSSGGDSDTEMKGTGKAKAPWQVAGSQAAKDRMADLRAKRGRTG